MSFSFGLSQKDLCQFESQKFKVNFIFNLNLSFFASYLVTRFEFHFELLFEFESEFEFEFDYEHEFYLSKFLF